MRLTIAQAAEPEALARQEHSPTIIVLQQYPSPWHPWVNAEAGLKEPGGQAAGLDWVTTALAADGGGEMRSKGLGLVLILCLIVPLSATTDPVDRSWEVLRKSLDDSNPKHRAAAVAALGSAGTIPRVVSIIESMLDDKDFEVRQTAAATLGEIKATSSIPRLRKALDDSAPEVVFTAAKALWNLGDESGRQIFIEVLQRDRGTSTGLVKSAMRDAKLKLHSPSTLAKMGINEASGAVLGPFSMGILVAEDAMKDGGRTSRALAANLLATDSDPATLQVLAEALTDKSGLVRAAAVKALGHRCASNAIPTIAPLLDDGHTAVRCMAAATIIKLNTIPYRAPGETTAPAVK